MAKESASKPRGEAATLEDTAFQPPEKATTAPSAPAKPRRGRWRILGIVVGILVVLFAFFIGSVTFLDYTESTPFCSLCHVMYPERTAYNGSPHSRVDCGTCHIGPGVIPAVQAKLENMRYLWVYPLNLYKRPIPSPITSLRPTTVVCEQCHWPDKFYENRLLVIPKYGEDQANSLTQIELLLKTGGGTQASGLGRGIHWHIENPVYYIATDDQRQVIPWVQATYNGKVTEYISTDSTLTPEDIAKAEKRKMDCVDCHNRATHIFEKPDDALNAALSAGIIPAGLPYIKQYGVEVLNKTYKTEEEGDAAVAGVLDLYKTEHPDIYSARQADIEKAVAGLQTIFGETQFPFMNVTWQSHPDNIGHLDSPGCFRCHDGKHLSSDNQAIRLECNLCHSIPEVAGPGQSLPAVQLPSSTEPDSHHSTTWLAEHRYKFDATCENCHTVDNPGGSDNSSFCSNSACHGTDWQYVGLNAPQVRQISAPPSVPSKGVPNPVPHPIGPRTDCELCHGPGKVRPAPDNHASFTTDMCTQCHQVTVTESGAAPAQQANIVPTIPHDLAGREDCLLCHNPDGGVVPAPADHTGRTNDQCQMCHKPGPVPTATPTASGGAQAGPPAIPHDLAGRDNCLMCHNPDGGVKPAPADHAGRTNDTCQACHKPAAAPEATSVTTPAAPSEGAQAGPPAIPHDLAGRDDCLICHSADSTRNPVPADHAGRTNDTCQTCHKPAAAAEATPAASAEGAQAGPPAIPHDLAGRDNCLICHAADSSIKPVPADHAGRTNDTCQACHKPKQ